MKKIRIAVVDDHAVFRKVLRVLLEKEVDFEVVAEAENGVAAVEIVGRHRPDVVLMDVNMPLVDGLSATRIIVSLVPQTKVLVLSMHSDEIIRVSAQAAGAALFLSKDCNPKGIIAAIRQVHHNTKNPTAAVPPVIVGPPPSDFTQGSA